MIELPATAHASRAPTGDRLLLEAAKQMPSINAVGRRLISGWLGLCGARRATQSAFVN